MRGGESLLLSADSEIASPPPYFASDDHLSISILRWREPKIGMVTSQNGDIRNIDDDAITKRYAADQDERLVSNRADK